MNIKDKLALEQPCEVDIPATIHLHKEGKFLVAYNESALLLRRDFWHELKIVRVTKKDGAFYHRSGFPLDSARAQDFLSPADLSLPLVRLSTTSGLGLDFDLSNVPADMVL